MFLRYRPDGATEDTLYEFRPDKTPTNRAIVAERLYSKLMGERQTWEQLKGAALTGGIAARRVALWVAMTDTHPFLRFDDVPEFATGQLSMEYSRHELRQMREGIEKSDMLEIEKRAALAQLDRDIDEAPIGSDEPDPDPDPDVVDPQGKGSAEVSPISNESSG